MKRTAFPAAGTKVKGKKGKYLLKRVVESDPASHVYLATREPGATSVGLRAYRLASLSEEARQRLEWDFGVRAQCDNANIWPVLDRFSAGGLEWVAEPGACLSTLAEFVGAPEVRKTALEVLIGALRALEYLHGRGVIHNNVCLTSILCDEGSRGYLAGFEYSHSEGACATGKPAPQSLPADPSYLAPELRSDISQARPASDLFSAGVTLYELLSGQQPYKSGPSDRTWLARERLAKIDPMISPALERVAQKAIAIDPSARFASAREMAAALAEVAATMPESERGELFQRTRLDSPIALREAMPQGPLAPADLLDRVYGLPSEGAPSGESRPPEGIAREKLAETHPAGSPPKGRPTSPLPDECETAVDRPTMAAPWAGEGHRVSDMQAGNSLYFVDGPRKGLSVDLDRSPEHTIGRGQTCDLRCEDHLLSRVHCTVRRQGDEFWLTDCGSRNGTFVNNQRIESCPIYHGDSLTIGSSTVLFFSKRPGGEGLDPRAQQVVQFSKIWEELLAAGNDAARFAEVARRLVEDELRPLLGFAIEEALPPSGFLAGFLVQTPRLWIRYTRFPILILYPHGGGEEFLEQIATMIATTQAREYFALVILATDSASRVEKVGGSVTDSVYRYDFVVLGGPDLKSLYVPNPFRRLVSLIQSRGLELSVLSPYVTGSPVSDSMFVGREDEVKRITQTIQNNNIALLGGRRIGKTSTLQKVHRLLAREKQYQTLYFDCQPIQDHASFFTALRYEGFESPGADPLGFRLIVNTILKKTGAHRVVALFDEVDELVEFDARNGGRLVKVFRSLAQEGKCRFVISGERVLYHHLQSADSPFFNFCHRIALDHLRPKNVEAIVCRPMRQLGILAEENERAVVDRMQEFTGGHAYLVQDLCERAVRLANERGAQGANLTVQDLDSILGSIEYLSEFKRTAFGTLDHFELAIVYLLVSRGMGEEEGFGKLAVIELLEGHSVNFDDREIDRALEILCLFKVLRSETKDGKIEYRFTLRRLPEAIKKTERPENVVESYLREIRGESRHRIPSWGAFA